MSAGSPRDRVQSIPDEELRSISLGALDEKDPVLRRGRLIAGAELMPQRQKKVARK